MRKMVFYTIILFLCANISLAYGKHNTAKYEKEFEKLDEQLYYRSHLAQEKLDSLTKLFSTTEQETYQPYVQYTQSFLAYHRGDYNTSLTMIDSALESFLYDKKSEWVARSLMLTAYNAEVSMLLENAEKAYEKAITYTDDNRLLGLAYAGMARVQKYDDELFGVNYNKAKSFLSLVDSRELSLYVKLLDAWFYPDSVTENELLLLVDNYAVLGMQHYIAMVYKILAIWYMREMEYEKAISVTNKAIDLASFQPTGYSSSLYHFTAKIAHKTSDLAKAESLCKEAIAINIKLGHLGNNYYIYRFLRKVAKFENRQRDLINYLENEMNAYQIHRDEELERTIIYFRLFAKIEFIQKELQVFKRRYLIMECCLSLLSLLIIGFALLSFKKKKQNYHILTERLKADNIILQNKTITLLVKSKKQDVQQEILASLQHIEKKIEKDSSLNKTLPNDFLDEYTNTLLLIEKKLPHLTGAEKRYAGLFALNIPQKEISKLLNVQISTVKTARRRLRVALNITDPKMKTNDYLLTLLTGGGNA